MKKDPRKILFLDIETFPSKVWTWGFWGVNISPDKIIEPGGLMCFAYAWDGSKKTHFVKPVNWKVFGEQTGDVWSRADVIEKIWDLLNEADVVVTYNGNGFDLQYLEREFTLLGRESPSPYVSVDLYAVMRREQKKGWPSLKLAHLSEQLNLSGKAPNDGFGLWLSCLKGDSAAWQAMGRYNKQDVALLVDMWPLLRHKVKNLPSASLYMDTTERVCPNCGSTDFQSRGIQRNKTRAYRRYFCNHCRDWFRENRSLNGAEAVVV